MANYYLKVDGKIVGRPKRIYEQALWAAEQLSKKLCKERGGVEPVSVTVDTYARNENAKNVTHIPGTPYRHRPTNPDFRLGRPFTYQITGVTLPYRGAKTFDAAKARALEALDLFGGREITIYENAEFTRINRGTFTRAQLLK